MPRYQYVGDSEVSLNNYGLVKPGDIVNVDFEINNPDFRKEIKETKEAKKTKK